MKTVVIYTEGTLGDHLPFIALGRALASRGHRVRLAIVRSMHRYAAGTGVETVTLPGLDVDASLAQSHADSWNDWDGIGRLARRRSRPRLPSEEHVEKVRLLLRLCAGADLFLSTSIRELPWVVSQVSEVPWVTVSLNASQYAPHRGTLSRRVVAAELDRFRLGRSKIGEVLAALGRSAARLPDTWHGFRAGTTLLASSRHFSRPYRDASARQTRLITTGFWFYDHPSWDGWHPSAALSRICAGRPRPLVLALSSQPVEERRRFLQEHARAAAALGRPLVVQRGWAGFSEGDLPSDVDRDRIVFTPFVPQEWLFARAGCAIQHGGIGSIARALVAGCPILVEPFGNDQFFNALRVIRLGIGAAMHPLRVRGADIARVLEAKVLSRPYRQRAAAIGRCLRREDGLGHACGAIEARMTSSSARARPW